MTGSRHDSEEDWLQAIAFSEGLNALFVDGTSREDNFKPVTGDQVASLFRLDLAQNTWAWRKVFQCSGCLLQTTTAIAVSGDDTMVAAYATKFDEEFHPTGYFFVVRASDRHYVSGIHSITHCKDDEGKLFVPNHAMHFDAYGVVYMAFGSEREDKGATNHDVDGEIKDHAPKFKVAGFTGSTGAKLFYHHLGIYFGESYAVTYADFGAGGSNLYVGGSVDTCYWQKDGPDPCFSLQIARMRPDGFKESQRQIYLEGGTYFNKAKE